MGEALSQVKSTMGPEAVILHTRTVQSRKWLGLRRREMVEITAGRGLNVGARQARRNVRPAAAAAELRGPAALYARSNGASAALPATTVTRTLAENGKLFLETPAAGNAVLLGLTSEMNSLKSMVQDLVGQANRQRAPQIPEELFEHYLQLTEGQVCAELAGEIVKNVHRQVRAEHLTQAGFVKEKIAEQIEKMLPTAGPIVRTRTQSPHVIALIGPTGVGKTTTLAKLAANLKLRDKHRVGLITLDTYRIAAVDQLKRYADIIGSPLRVVSGVEDLKEAVRSMQEFDFLLIDTAGRSPNDTLKLNELRGLLNVAEPDEVHLVLSTTASAECLELAINRFADVRVDKLIFTKLDEAPHLGIVLNVVRKANKCLSYITTGQDVPDDIEVGHGKRLAELILGESL